jgi:NAD(P)-dependent dehydrogenase (short-subunit alcohol dehydrogenase family)
VLITGCSQHGLGHALAVAFQKAGFRVFATARDVGRMAGLADLEGVECLELDVCDEESIRKCVAKVEALTKKGEGGEEGNEEGSLDCLVNNAGGGMIFQSCSIFPP